MASKKLERRLFESDRRMEFRLRLAAKRAGEEGPQEALGFGPMPEREIVDRLIDKVRRL